MLEIRPFDSFKEFNISFDDKHQHETLTESSLDRHTADLSYLTKGKPLKLKMYCGVWYTCYKIMSEYAHIGGAIPFDSVLLNDPGSHFQVFSNKGMIYTQVISTRFVHVVEMIKEIFQVIAPGKAFSPEAAGETFFECRESLRFYFLSVDDAERVGQEPLSQEYENAIKESCVEYPEDE